VTPAIPKPEFTLTATDGRPFDFRKETDGFVTLLFFGYTSCPDICPVHLANLGEVLRSTPGEVAGKVKVVFVTTDPDRDSLPVIRAWLDAFNPRFVGLRGSVEDVNAVLASVWMPAAVQEPLPDGGYGVGHPASVLAFTRDNVAHVIYPFGIRQQDWVHDLPLLVREDGSGA
jgi:protein SCO1/2